MHWAQRVLGGGVRHSSVVTPSVCASAHTSFDKRSLQYSSCKPGQRILGEKQLKRFLFHCADFIRRMRSRQCLMRAVMTTVLCLGVNMVWHYTALHGYLTVAHPKLKTTTSYTKSQHTLRMDLIQDFQELKTLEGTKCMPKTEKYLSKTCTFVCDGRFQVGDGQTIVEGRVESIDSSSYTTIAHRGLMLLGEVLGKRLVTESSRVTLSLEDLEPYLEEIHPSRKCWHTRHGDRFPALLTVKYKTGFNAKNNAMQTKSFHGGSKELLAHTILQLYLANCDFNSSMRMLSGEVDWFDIVCFNTEEWEGRNSGMIADQLYDQDTLCHLPLELIRRLERANEPTSFVSSIGVQLKRAMTKEGLQPLNSHTIFLELDGRVTNIIGQYMTQCVLASNHTQHPPFDQLLREAYKPIVYVQKAKVIAPGFWGKLDNKFQLYLKTVSTVTLKARWYNQGLSEVVAYYVDRIIGLYRVQQHFVPTSISQQLGIPQTLNQWYQMQKNVPIEPTWNPHICAMDSDVATERPLQ